MDNWLISNPGTPISIYNIAKIVEKAYPQAFVPSNIINGFERTGISPYNSCIFAEDDYLSSYLTDRPLAKEENIFKIITSMCDQLKMVPPSKISGPAKTLETSFEQSKS